MVYEPVTYRTAPLHIPGKQINDGLRSVEFIVVWLCLNYRCHVVIELQLSSSIQLLVPSRVCEREIFLSKCFGVFQNGLRSFAEL